MRAGFGVLLIIISIILLVVIIVVPVLPATAENNSVDALFSRVLCQPGEQLVREQYSTTDYDGTGYSMNAFCVTEAGQRTDVSARWFLYGGAAFLVPFLIGLVLLIVGLRGRQRPVPSEVYNMAGVRSTPARTPYNPQSAPPSSNYDLSDIAPTMAIRPSQVQAAQQAAVQQAASQQAATQEVPAAAPTMQMRPMPLDPNSLTAKLKQIEDARNSGLITAEEYERLRQEIIGNIS